MLDATIDRIASSPSFFIHRDCLHKLAQRLCADLRSNPRDKSLVLLLSKLLGQLQNSGDIPLSEVAPSSLSKDDLTELIAAMNSNKTPLKRGVLTLLRSLLGDTQ